MSFSGFLRYRKCLTAAAAFTVAVVVVSAVGQDTSIGDYMTPLNGYDYDPFFTVGEGGGLGSVNGYTPPGILDGTAAFQNNGYVRVLVNHEFVEGAGYAYQLANGTWLEGARVSYFDIDPATRTVEDAGLAYDVIYDRFGNAVTDPAQVNEDGNGMDGLARLCSANHVEPGDYGFVDRIFFTGEETGAPFHPHGGTEWILDVDGHALYAAPDLGRGAWENVTPLDTGDGDTIALLLGDDTQAAPLYLYLGEKEGSGFLERNGLENGQLYFWRADARGTGTRMLGIPAHSTSTERTTACPRPFPARLFRST